MKVRKMTARAMCTKTRLPVQLKETDWVMWIVLRWISVWWDLRRLSKDFVILVTSVYRDRRRLSAY